MKTNAMTAMVMKLVLVGMALTGAGVMSAPVAWAAEVQVVHVYVALCDNASQGIIPVPAKIGDGDKPDDWASVPAAAEPVGTTGLRRRDAAGVVRLSSAGWGAEGWRQGCGGGAGVIGRPSLRRLSRLGQPDYADATLRE